MDTRVLRFASIIFLTWASLVTALGADSSAQKATPDPARQLREYRDFALGRDGNAARGRDLFNNQERAACAKCHSVDGTSSKAGPDLLAVGDKFPRRELIRAVLEPSTEIAIGYGTTIVETKSGQTFQGVLKESRADALDLQGADGQHVGVPTADIQEQRGSAVSLMPEGLLAGWSRAEFADLIEYLVTLKEPTSALTSRRGMPAEIPKLAQPVSRPGR